MGDDLLKALALLLVIEGMLPFLSPDMMRKTFEQFLQMDNRTIRITGFVSMMLGVGLLYLVR